MRILTPKRSAPMRLAAVVACSALLAGCGASGGSGRIVSIDQPLVLQPKFITKAYESGDVNTADIYLTDFSDDELAAFFDPAGGWGTLSGQIVHVHMFVRPTAGRTPIQSTACSASVRYILIADGEIGVYAGAGFMLPKGSTGDKTFGGSIKNAPIRLETSTARFDDRLGPSEITLSFGAKLDEERSREMRDIISALVGRADETSGE